MDDRLEPDRPAIGHHLSASSRKVKSLILRTAISDRPAHLLTEGFVEESGRKPCSGNRLSSYPESPTSLVTNRPSTRIAARRRDGDPRAKQRRRASWHGCPGTGSRDAEKRGTCRTDGRSNQLLAGTAQRLSREGSFFRISSDHCLERRRCARLTLRRGPQALRRRIDARAGERRTAGHRGHCGPACRGFRVLLR